jgi:hypothetical protein
VPLDDSRDLSDEEDSFEDARSSDPAAEVEVAGLRVDVAPASLRVFPTSLAVYDEGDDTDEENDFPEAKTVSVAGLQLPVASRSLKVQGRSVPISSVHEGSERDQFEERPAAPTVELQISTSARPNGESVLLSSPVSSPMSAEERDALLAKSVHEFPDNCSPAKRSRAPRRRRSKANVCDRNLFFVPQTAV